MSYKTLYFPKVFRRSKYNVYSQYRDYKHEIRVDCLGRCVYCDAHENELGGHECMTLDHFRPKDKYKHLECDPTNLVWACLKCNNYKQNFWPAVGTPHTFVGDKGFIDPFMEDRSDYFDILPNGRLTALKVPAAYIINTLKLNRTGAKKIREKRNKGYESKQKTEEFFLQSVKQIDTLLEHSSFPKELEKELRQHKEILRHQYDLMKQNLEPDFNLY